MKRWILVFDTEEEVRLFEEVQRGYNSTDASKRQAVWEWTPKEAYPDIFADYDPYEEEESW